MGASLNRLTHKFRVGFTVFMHVANKFFVSLKKSEPIVTDLHCGL